MLPEIRQSDYLYDVPKFDLVRTDIDDLINDLKAFHEDFADCFQRSESRDNFLRYMSGQFSPIERKSIEPISFAIEGAQVRAMQRFVSDAPWDDKKIMSKYRYLVNEDLGHPDGAIVFDECQRRLERMPFCSVRKEATSDRLKGGHFLQAFIFFPIRNQRISFSSVF